MSKAKGDAIGTDVAFCLPGYSPVLLKLHPALDPACSSDWSAHIPRNQDARFDERQGSDPRVLEAKVARPRKAPQLPGGSFVAGAGFEHATFGFLLVEIKR
jgi:hypothetical protein